MATSDDVEGQLKDDNILLKDKVGFVLGFNDEIFKFAATDATSNTLVMRHHTDPSQPVRACLEIEVSLESGWWLAVTTKLNPGRQKVSGCHLSLTLTRTIDDRDILDSVTVLDFRKEAKSKKVPVTSGHKYALRIKVVKNSPQPVTAAASHSWTSPPLNRTSLEHMSDVDIIDKDGRRIKCHRIHLAKASPVFAAMFDHRDFVETEFREVKIDDFDCQTLTDFIDHLYGGCLPDASRYKSVDLLAIANKYQVTGLKSLVSDHLAVEICHETVADLWVASEMHQAFKLKVAVHDFLCENWTFSNLEEISGIGDIVRTRPEYLCDLLTYMNLK